MDRIGQRGGGDLAVGQVGDREHGFAAGQLLGKGFTSAGELDRQRGVEEADSGGDCDQFYRSGLDPPVTLLVVVSAVRPTPRARRPLTVQAGLVALGDGNACPPARTDR